MSRTTQGQLGCKRGFEVAVEPDVSSGEWTVTEYYRCGWSVLHRCGTEVAARLWRRDYLRQRDAA